MATDNASSSKQFNADIDRFAEAMRVDASLAYKRIVFEAWRRIVLRSPVDTGAFRSNWRISEETPDETVTLKEGSFNNKTKARRRFKFDAGPATPPGPERLTWTQDFPLIWINNSLPYAERLETGWSKQAPRGMVALTLSEITTFMRQTIKSAGT